MKKIIDFGNGSSTILGEQEQKTFEKLYSEIKDFIKKYPKEKLYFGRLHFIHHGESRCKKKKYLLIDKYILLMTCGVLQRETIPRIIIGYEYGQGNIVRKFIQLNTRR